MAECLSLSVTSEVAGHPRTPNPTRGPRAQGFRPQALSNQGRSDLSCRLRPDRLFHVIHDPYELGQDGQRHLAEGHTAVFLVLGLKGAGELLVALVGHDVELVHRVVEDTKAVLVDR